jgi:hypothetical protein
MKLRFALLAAATISLSGAAAQAATIYSAKGDFSIVSNPNGAWAYGTGVAGSSFSPMTVSGYGVLNANFAYWQVAVPTSLVPLIGVNTGATTDTFGTLIIPTDVLFMHPGPSTDAIVQWTAPSAGAYQISGSFELLDDKPSGIIGEVYDNSSQLYAHTLTGPPADVGTLTPGGSEQFSETVTLAPGDIISFAVNNDGSFYDDSTGLMATITAVPEPATWAMMVFGIGGLGSGLRLARRRSLATIAA